MVSARFLGGLAFSSISVASMYIGEIAPPKLRGKLVSMTQINIVLGLSAGYFINYLIIQFTNSDASWVDSLGLRENTWRWMLGSEILPALLWLVLLFFIPRSPSWLMFNGKKEEAKNTLRKLIPEEEVIIHINEMQESMNSYKLDYSKTYFQFLTDNNTSPEHIESSNFFNCLNLCLSFFLIKFSALNV